MVAQDSRAADQSVGFEVDRRPLAMTGVVPHPREALDLSARPVQVERRHVHEVLRLDVDLMQRFRVLGPELAQQQPFGA